MNRAVLRFLGKCGLYLGGIGLFLGALAIRSPEAFVRVPPERHSELMGSWYVDRYGSFRKYVFNRDGTGEIYVPEREPRKFRWGTTGQTLRLKYQTQYGWSAPLFEFKIGNQVNLKAIENGYSMTLKREAPASARLQ